MGNNNSHLLQLFTKFRIMTAKMIPDCILDRIYNKNVSVSSKSTEMINDGDTLYVKSEWFMKNEWITIANGMSLSIPYKYEELLTLLYGDYKKYMPIEARINEFCNALSRIENLGKQ